MCYQRGAGTWIDWAEAESWLLRSSEQGNAEALLELGEYYNSKAPKSKQDRAKAYAYATLAYDIKGNNEWTHDGRTIVRNDAKWNVEFLEAAATSSQKAEGVRLADEIRGRIIERTGKAFRMNGPPANSSASLFSNSSGTSFVIIGGSQEMRGEPPYRYYRITGEVKNVGRTPDIPQIEMKLRNSSGRVIKSANTLPSDTPVKLQPGETCGLDQRIYSDDPNCTLEVRFIEMAPLPR
jgi:hypothetical protein